jgi:hypothetical protein
MGGNIALDERRALEQPQMERDRRFDRADIELVQRPLHDFDGFLAVFSVGDDLASIES